MVARGFSPCGALCQGLKSLARAVRPRGDAGALSSLAARRARDRNQGLQPLGRPTDIL